MQKEEIGIIKIENDDDPDRCQAIQTSGKEQCRNKAVPNGSYCLVHGGRHQEAKEKKQGLRNYRLTMFKARIEELGSSNEVKNLRDEIGILRMVLETVINKCESTTDLILQNHVISDLIDKISKTVGSCHKIEGSMGKLVDKQSLLQFASEIISIIDKHIEDKEALEKISNSIFDSLSRAGKKEDE